VRKETAVTIIDAPIDRMIVVDEERRPIGIVSTTDLVAALAYESGSNWAPAT